MNPVAAKISLGVKTAGGRLRAACFEVGVDGRKPDSPVAVAEPDLSLRIGTPFLWSREAQPRYAVVLALEGDGAAEHAEIQFGFDAGGKLVVTQALRKIPFPPPRGNEGIPSLFVAGDSTAFSNGKNQRGWGDELGKCFDFTLINVFNRARPGRSTRSFRNEGLWSRVLAEMKAGDFVLIQFGHNDADQLAEGRCRGVLPDIGEETQAVLMPDGTCEIVRTYGWYLRQFVAETKAKGVTPILLSLTVKNVWEHGRLQRDQSQYGHWAAAVAQAAGVDFIDLNQIIADRYDELGHAKVQPLFCSASDHVHTSPAGAALNAACVAAGLKPLMKSPLQKFLSP